MSRAHSSLGHTAGWRVRSWLGVQHTAVLALLLPLPLTAMPSPFLQAAAAGRGAPRPPLAGSRTRLGRPRPGDESRQEPVPAPSPVPRTLSHPRQPSPAHTGTAGKVAASSPSPGQPWRSAAPSTPREGAAQLWGLSRASPSLQHGGGEGSSHCPAQTWHGAASWHGTGAPGHDTPGLPQRLCPPSKAQVLMPPHQHTRGALSRRPPTTTPFAPSNCSEEGATSASAPQATAGPLPSAPRRRSGQSCFAAGVPLAGRLFLGLFLGFFLSGAAVRGGQTPCGHSLGGFTRCRGRDHRAHRCWFCSPGGLAGWQGEN